MIKIKEKISLYDAQPKASNMLDEVVSGLSQEQKTLSPKFFYDEHGSKLFDEICEAPEYYITNTEMDLLGSILLEVQSLLPKDFSLFELGSGSSQKIRILLETLKPSAYVPIDISKEHLIDAARSLSSDYPWLDIHAACVDFSDAWNLPFKLSSEHRLAFFPGSSIGNFQPSDAATLLKEVGQLVGKDGSLLIGIDLVKDSQILESAYNDSLGVTERFNLNILSHINNTLDADFKLENFKHHAFFNEQKSRIEMHLVSLTEQTVNISGHTFKFKANESIHTENSYKYTVESFKSLCESAGFRPVQVWTDPQNLFSLHFLRFEAQ